MSSSFERIEFIYSPQRSSKQITHYRFDLTSKKLTVRVTRGREELVRKCTNYHMQFIQNENDCDEDELSLENLIDNQYVQSIIEQQVIKLTLLKQYSCEHEHNPDITYPATVQVFDSLWDEELSTGKSCLTPIERVKYFGMIQVNELYLQFHNLLTHLKTELLAKDPSPITIRGLKTSLLLLTAASVEAITNFVGSLALELNAENNLLNQQQLELLAESRDFPRRKNTPTLKRFSTYFHYLYLVSGAHKVEPDVSKLKGILENILKKRNALIHVRTTESTLSISQINQQVEITERDLADSFVSMASCKQLLLVALSHNVPSKTNMRQDLWFGFARALTTDILSDITGLPQKSIEEQINQVAV